MSEGDIISKDTPFQSNPGPATADDSMQTGPDTAYLSPQNHAPPTAPAPLPAQSVCLPAPPAPIALTAPVALSAPPALPAPTTAAPPADKPWRKYPARKMSTGTREAITKSKIGPLKRTPKAEAFLNPSSRGIPRSFHRLMDIQTLGEKLEKDMYYSVRDFMKDFYIIIDNCRRGFAGKKGHHQRREALSLKHWFETKMSDLRLP